MDALKASWRAGELLPLWMGFVGCVAVFNSVQNYLTLSFTRRVYDRSPSQVTGLSARTFGTWTLLSAIIRVWAAVEIHDPTLYRLALVTYYLALGHFATETLVYRTAGKGALSPFIVSSLSLVWMHSQWSYYVR